MTFMKNRAVSCQISELYLNQEQILYLVRHFWGFNLLLFFFFSFFFLCCCFCWFFCFFFLYLTSWVYLSVRTDSTIIIQIYVSSWLCIFSYKIRRMAFSTGIFDNQRKKKNIKNSMTEKLLSISNLLILLQFMYYRLQSISYSLQVYSLEIYRLQPLIVLLQQLILNSH